MSDTKAAFDEIKRHEQALLTSLMSLEYTGVNLGILYAAMQDIEQAIDAVKEAVGEYQ